VAHPEKDTMVGIPELAPDIQKRLLDYLSGFITPDRRKKFEDLIRFRTRYLTIVLEDIYQSHNASAVLRTCECFGIQDVHIIENINKYNVNPDVALGSSKWLSLEKYNRDLNNTISCLTQLKRKGYRIICTTPHKDDYTPATIPLDHKLALVFGTELAGLSDAALVLADGFIKIPMVGFTESLNISVSAAVFIHTLSDRIRNSKVNWPLSESERISILLMWTANTIKQSEMLITGFLRREQIT